MVAFNKKSFEDYSPFAQILATYMWDQHPPLNPAQFAANIHIDYLTVYCWFTNKATPDLSHLIRIAQHTPLSIQALFVAARYGSETYPLFSRTDTWNEVIDTVNASDAITTVEKQNVLRILALVRQEAESSGYMSSLALYTQETDETSNAQDTGELPRIVDT